MTTTRDSLIARLWHGRDPFCAAAEKPFDAQGWYSDHHYLTDAAALHADAIMIEVGVWKGAGTLAMARQMRARSGSGAIVAVDTWLGSSEHWLDRRMPRRPDGRPEIYETFLSNIVREGLTDYIVPLPLDSAGAADVLTQLGILAGAIHIDAGHSYESASTDLRLWWPILAPGGTLIADDYGNRAWPDVARAVDAFRAAVDRSDFEVDGVKCRMVKASAA